MNVGTWNMEGRSAAAQSRLLLQQSCDLWLLTEVPVNWSLPGFQLAPSTALMGPRKHWAAIASREPATQVADPHPASAAVKVGGVTYVSSILPWRGCGSGFPWIGATHAERMNDTLDGLEPFLSRQDEVVWGGDWNQSLQGNEAVGSHAGRIALRSLIDRLGLWTPTAQLPHRNDVLSSIDHIALKAPSATAWRVVAEAAGVRLSDHDAYVVAL